MTKTVDVVYVGPFASVDVYIGEAPIHAAPEPHVRANEVTVAHGETLTVPHVVAYGAPAVPDVWDVHGDTVNVAADEPAPEGGELVQGGQPARGGLLDQPDNWKLATPKAKPEPAEK